MTDEDQAPVYSPLSRSLTRDGKTVRIEIYEDGEGGWLLEVVDQEWNSTLWDMHFESDRDALAEAINTIEAEGIDSMIGPPKDQTLTERLDGPLTEEELDELDCFLAGTELEETSMDVSTLDGFLAAIAIGPSLVKPSEWFPWIWDMEVGELEPDFDNKDHASRITSLIIRHYNAVTHTFNTDPAAFEPIFWRGEQWGAAEWCEGFILGCTFDEDSWGLLAAGQPTWFTPFLRLGTDEGVELTKNARDGEKWMNEIEPSLIRINAYWKESRKDAPSGLINDNYRIGGVRQIARHGAMVGRNDPCPCGSGKKFKRCCGGDGTPSTVH